jgi:polyisoprenoid-binding protein YceI
MAVAVCLLWASLATPANGQQLVLQCDPAQTAADFTLGDVLHTVKGSFSLKSGEIRFDPVSGKIGGEIVFDATSGHSGNQSRDRKMHKDVLESVRYPEIGFRPDRVDGKVTAGGTSTVQVHGMFRIHGTEHEITAPAEVELDGDHWTVLSHFPVPYAKWGIKNPSVLFLRVGDSVEIVFHGTGSVTPAAPR